MHDSKKTGITNQVAHCMAQLMGASMPN